LGIVVATLIGILVNTPQNGKIGVYYSGMGIVSDWILAMVFMMSKIAIILGSA
jgi:hypothetical protein